MLTFEPINMTENGPTFHKYAFLRELKLKEDNDGVFCGQWFGNGQRVSALNPTTGEIIAYVRTASLDDYHRSVEEAHKAQKVWANVSISEGTR